MYVSRITFQIKSTQTEEFLTTVQSVTKAALDMPGCQTFMILVSPFDSSQYVLYEEWGTVEQADNFKQTRIRNESVAKLAPAMEAAPRMVEFEAQKRT